MELLWMILLVVLVCAEAEDVTEVKAKLGQNVTLNCSLNNSDIFWYMEIHNQFRVNILRTFGKDDNNPKYSNPGFKTKYSVLENRLVITNITAEDYRRYFCAWKQNDIIHFEDTIRLVSDVPTTPSTNDSKPNDCKPNNDQQQKIWPVIFRWFSFVLFLIGLCFIFLYLRRQKSKYQKNEPSSPIYENAERP